MRHQTLQPASSRREKDDRSSVTTPALNELTGPELPGFPRRRKMTNIEEKGRLRAHCARI